MQDMSQSNDFKQKVQESFNKLISLVGVWRGKGIGGYPTIEDFNYTETFRVQHDPEDSYLTYEQKTELIDKEGRPIRNSHWETGILRLREDGSIELVCVQGSGRVEVLQGELIMPRASQELLAIRFQSELIANDDRVGKSTREWRVGEDQFNYRIEMSTSDVARLTLHLEASLSKP